MRDERWDTQTCTLGFTVMGIWPKSKPGERAADGTDINACDRGPVPGRDALGRRNKGELLVTVDDNGKVKLFNYPCVVKHAPYRRMDWRDRPGLARKPAGLCVGYVGHSSHVVNVRFANDGANVISVGGFDRAVFQWKVDEDAVEQRGRRRDASSLGLTSPTTHRRDRSFRERRSSPRQRGGAGGRSRGKLRLHRHRRHRRRQGGVDGRRGDLLGGWGQAGWPHDCDSRDSAR